MIKNNLLHNNDISNIERFEHKNNKLKKNIERLFNCYVLSLNQNGGVNNELSLQIKKRLDKKITELLVQFPEETLESGYTMLAEHKNYLKNLEGGEILSLGFVTALTLQIYSAIIINSKNPDFNLKDTIKAVLEQYLDKKLTDVPFFDPYTKYESVSDKSKNDIQPKQHVEPPRSPEHPHPLQPIQDFLNLFKFSK
jgi:hypothetical protein